MLYTIISTTCSLEPNLTGSKKQTLAQKPSKSLITSYINKLVNLMNGLRFEQTSITRLFGSLNAFISPNQAHDKSSALKNAYQLISEYFNQLFDANEQKQHMLIEHLISQFDLFESACYEGREHLARKLVFHASMLIDEAPDTQTFFWQHLLYHSEQALVQKKMTLVSPSFSGSGHDQHIAKNIQNFLHAHGMAQPSQSIHFALGIHYNFLMYQWIVKHFNGSMQAKHLMNAIGARGPSTWALTDLKDENTKYKRAILETKLTALTTYIKSLTGVSNQHATTITQWMMPPLTQLVWVHHKDYPNALITFEARHLQPYGAEYYWLDSQYLQLSPDTTPDTTLDHLPGYLLIHMPSCHQKKTLYLSHYDGTRSAFKVSIDKKKFDATNPSIPTDFETFIDLPAAITAFNPHETPTVATDDSNTSQMAQFKAYLAQDNKHFGAKYSLDYQRQRFMDAWSFFNGRCHNDSMNFLEGFSLELLEMVANQMIILRSMHDHQINQKLCKISLGWAFHLDNSLYKTFVVFANKQALNQLLTLLSEEDKPHRREPEYLFTFAYYILSASPNTLAARLQKIDRIYSVFKEHAPQNDHKYHVTTLECIAYYTYLARITKANFQIYEIFIDFLACIPQRLNKDHQTFIYTKSVELVSMFEPMFELRDNNNIYVPINWVYQYITELALMIWFFNPNSTNSNTILKSAFARSINNFLANEHFRTWLFKYLNDSSKCFNKPGQFIKDYEDWMNAYYTNIKSTSAQYANLILSPALFFEEEESLNAYRQFCQDPDNLTNDLDGIQLTLSSLVDETNRQASLLEKIQEGFKNKTIRYLKPLEHSLKLSGPVLNLIYKLMVYIDNKAYYPQGLLERLIKACHDIQIGPNNFNRLLYGAVIMIGLWLMYNQFLWLGAIMAAGSIFMLLYPYLSSMIKHMLGYQTVYLCPTHDAKPSNIWLHTSDVSFFKQHACEKNFQFIDLMEPPPTFKG